MLTTAKRVLVGAILVAASVLWAAAPAQAHNYLVSSTPAAHSIVTELPDAFVITTNEPLLQLGDSAGAFALEVRDAAGAYYGDGCYTVDGPSLIAGATLGEPGVYTVVWQVVSGDGHSVSDTLTFTWAPDDAAQVSEGASAPPVCGEASSEQTGTATAEPAPQTEPAAPETPAQNVVDPAPVLWVGGALLAVGLAVGITIFTVSRRNP